MLSKDNIKNDVKGTGCEEVEWSGFNLFHFSKSPLTFSTCGRRAEVADIARVQPYAQPTSRPG
jgi:hypothetical protein